MDFNLIVAGGRDFNDYELMSRVLFALADVELADKNINIVSGVARGADALAIQFAKEHQVNLYEVPADWNKYGKSAGYKRNEVMANMSHGLVAFWDGHSKGTKHMIDIAKNKGLFVKVVNY